MFVFKQRSLFLFIYVALVNKALCSCLFMIKKGAKNEANLGFFNVHGPISRRRESEKNLKRSRIFYKKIHQKMFLPIETTFKF